MSVGTDGRVFVQDHYYFFTAIGMKLHRLLPDGSLHPIPRYKESCEQFAFVALSPAASTELGGTP